MKYLLIFALLLGACTQNSTKKQGHVIDDSKQSQYLFVISAHSGSLENETLTLETVPLAIYFTDKPYRKAGHLTLQAFLKKWEKGATPNAALSILDGEKMQDAVIELMEPQIKNNTLIFKVKVLENDIPKTFGFSSLFIDYESSPLTSLSPDSKN